MGVLPASPFALAMDVAARNGDVVYRPDLPGIDPAGDLTVARSAATGTALAECSEPSTASNTF